MKSTSNPVPLVAMSAQALVPEEVRAAFADAFSKTSRRALWHDVETQAAMMAALGAALAVQRTVKPCEGIAVVMGHGWNERQHCIGCPNHER